MVEFNEKYDYDFIKMMPFGAYTTSDWGTKLEIFCDKYKEVEIAAPAISSLEDYKRPSGQGRRIGWPGRNR